MLKNPSRDLAGQKGHRFLQQDLLKTYCPAEEKSLYAKGDDDSSGQGAETTVWAATAI